MKLRTTPIDLQLRHTFRLSRGASDVRHNLVVELEHEGLIGLGEAAPIARYHQTRESAAAAVELMSSRLGDPRRFDRSASAAAVPGQPSAEAAVDMALFDLAAKRCGVPLHEMLGLEPSVPPTSFTIAIDAPEVMPARVAEAPEYEVLKIKLGSPDDRAMLEAVRSATTQRLRIDANEGWTLDEALGHLEWLAALGVEMVEQPLPAADLEGMRVLKQRSPLPLFADESVGRAVDIPKLADAFHGINIKLMKCGGIGEALRMIHVARAHGLQVMLGCMIESSIAITAAAQIASLVDFVDLDGHVLISNDPFVGAEVVGGRLVLPPGPGLGVAPRAWA